MRGITTISNPTNRKARTLQCWTKGLYYTCVMSSVHVAVMITNRIQVIKVVVWVTAKSVRSSPGWPMGGQAPATLTSLHHMGRHIHANQRKSHHVLHLHPPVTFLEEISEINNYQEKAEQMYTVFKHVVNNHHLGRFYGSSIIPVWISWGVVWEHQAGSTGWVWSGPVAAVCSGGSARHHQVPTGTHTGSGHEEKPNVPREFLHLQLWLRLNFPESSSKPCFDRGQFRLTTGYIYTLRGDFPGLRMCLQRTSNFKKALTAEMQRPWRLCPQKQLVETERVHVLQG